MVSPGAYQMTEFYVAIFAWFLCVCTFGPPSRALMDYHLVKSGVPFITWCRKGKEGKVLYGQELPSGESTTTECGVNYQLLAVITEASQWLTPSCSCPQPATDNGVRYGRSNWLVAPLTLMGSTPWAPRIARC